MVAPVKTGRTIHANQRKVVGAPEQDSEETDRCVARPDCFYHHAQQANKHGIFGPGVDREWVDSSFKDYSVVG